MNQCGLIYHTSISIKSKSKTHEIRSCFLKKFFVSLCIKHFKMNYTQQEHILLIDYLESLLQGQKDYLDVLYHTYKDYAACVKLQGAIELLEKRIKFHKKQLADGYYNY